MSREPEILAAIPDEDFRRLSELLHSGFGIKLAPEKKALVAGRLQKLLRERGGLSFAEYYRQVVEDGSGREISELINRLSTNHTFFNREKEHFEHFLQVALPEAAARARGRGCRDVRVWCAASSTGEEPWMLAMLMREYFGPDFATWDLGLLATDISERALEVARAGIYSEERVRDLPRALRDRWLTPRGEDFEISPVIRPDVTYRRLNLINPQYPFKRKFDVIFCRNVMIYFDTPTKTAVVERMAQHLAPGGHLYIGHSETLGRETAHFQYLRPAAYRRKAGA